MAMVNIGVVEVWGFDAGPLGDGWGLGTSNKGFPSHYTWRDQKVPF